MSMVYIKKLATLLIMIFILALTACGEEKAKLNSCESFVISQFKELYDTDVEVSEGKLSKEELSEKELSEGETPDDIYSCKVKVAGELYDTVVHIDEQGNMEMFTSYEGTFYRSTNKVLGYNEYWHTIADYSCIHWGLEDSYESIFWLQTDKAFDSFAEKLTQLDLDSFETAYFVRVEYMNNRIIVPIRKEHTAEDYKEMLDQLLPEVELVEKDSEQSIMFRAAWTSRMPSNAIGDGLESVGYNVYYDGTIEIEVYNIYAGTEVRAGGMSNYDYSLLRHALEEFEGYEYDAGEVYDGATWNMAYYDKSGNIIHWFSGYIYGSDLLEERIERILYKYYLE